jgi:hypothetical protein
LCFLRYNSDQAAAARNKGKRNWLFFWRKPEKRMVTKLDEEGERYTVCPVLLYLRAFSQPITHVVMLFGVVAYS